MASEDPPKATSKVNMDPKFEKRFRDLQDHAKKEEEERKQGGQVKWFRPEGWDGDLSKVELSDNPFERKQANEEGVDAVKDGKSPGTTGDIVTAVTQIDTLAVMERAFRVRHFMRRPRAVAHLLARKKGHGDSKGAFGENGVEYVRALMKASRGES